LSIRSNSILGTITSHHANHGPTASRDTGSTARRTIAPQTTRNTSDCNFACFDSAGDGSLLDPLPRKHQSKTPPTHRGYAISTTLWSWEDFVIAYTRPNTTKPAASKATRARHGNLRCHTQRMSPVLAKCFSDYARGDCLGWVSEVSRDAKRTVCN
jgi:hypothetical protein